MRGLTDQERRELEWSAGTVDVYVERTVAVRQLMVRGLVRFDGRGVTATDAGRLALRLDAAARAMGGGNGIPRSA